MTIRVESQDLVESGGSLSEEAGGLSDVRKFLVKGLSTVDIPAPLRRWKAIQASAVGSIIPQYGAPHPSGANSWVRNRTSTMLDGDTSLVVVQYGPLDVGQFLEGAHAPVLTVGSTLVEIETNYDANGKPIITQHDGETEVVQTIRKLEPLTTFSYEATQLGSPGDLSRVYVGTVNDAIVFGTDNPGTWICSRLDGRLVNIGDNRYSVSYEFIYRPEYAINKPGSPGNTLTIEGWQTVVVEHDPITGQPYKFNDWKYEGTDALPGKRTIAIVDVYLKKDFIALPLTAPG